MYKVITKPRYLGKNLVLLNRNYSKVQFPQESKEYVSSDKPTLSQFKNPLLHFFLIASSTYIIMNGICITLENKEREKEIIKEQKSLESKIQTHFDKENLKRWYSMLKFWNR